MRMTIEDTEGQIFIDSQRNSNKSTKKMQLDRPRPKRSYSHAPAVEPEAPSAVVHS